MRTDLLAAERAARRRRVATKAVASLALLLVVAVAAWRAVATMDASAPSASGGGAAALRPALPAVPARAPQPGEGGLRADAARDGDGDGEDEGEARGDADGNADAASVAARAKAGDAALVTRPLVAWLGDIAGDAGRDLVVAPELRGDLTASGSRRLPWEQRLEAYARVAGFDFAVRDGLIEAWRASPGDGRDGGARGDHADDAASPDAAGAGDTTAVAPAPKPLSTRVLRLANAPAKETAAALSKAGDVLDVAVAADPASNALVLAGDAAAIARVQALVAEIDKPRRRILLEAKIVEVTRSARLDLGVEWKVTGDFGGEVKFPPQASDAGSAALLIATGGATALDARISAMEADGRLRVVSRPRVVMVEGSPATIESVRILRIRLPSQGSVVGEEVVAGPASGRATEDIPVGVRLEVTPAVRGAARVLLRIRAKSSNLGAPLPPDDIPEELSRMVDAEVLVGSGETAVLGGLSREAGQDGGAGVPGLRRIPGLGRLFGKRSDVDAEEELLVLVTPRLLD